MCFEIDGFFNKRDITKIIVGKRIVQRKKKPKENLRLMVHTN
jgi:hypothetical protein